MRLPIVQTLALTLALGISLVAAIPFEADGSTTNNTGSEDCTSKAINNCVALTGLGSAACFAQVCAGIREADLKMAKRQEDSCTEENLLQCAVGEWRDAEVCFQEFCL
ncbi:hypothetical protein F4779DRAFT_614671 [Xylariaceae sp. FL0662B]|nr:hypothetical protein F4779DRAFT_614671 [Xylariaceae sp. FL0662B]